MTELNRQQLCAALGISEVKRLHDKFLIPGTGPIESET